MVILCQHWILLQDLAELRNIPLLEIFVVR